MRQDIQHKKKPKRQGSNTFFASLKRINLRPFLYVIRQDLQVGGQP